VDLYYPRPILTCECQQSKYPCCLKHEQALNRFCYSINQFHQPFKSRPELFRRSLSSTRKKRFRLASTIHRYKATTKKQTSRKISYGYGKHDIYI
jgi:hypothetical protein